MYRWGIIIWCEMVIIIRCEMVIIIWCELRDTIIIICSMVAF